MEVSMRSVAARRVMILAALVALVGLGLSGLHAQSIAPRPIRIATTTSVANTGLLDTLLTVFQKETGIRVDYLAEGTGKALKHGENGDVDLLLVHAVAAEEEFVRAGFGVSRVPLMWNDFVIAGPPADPAGIAGTPSATEAFRRIAAFKAPFVSRGDESGTHKKEKEIWAAEAVTPQGEWYVEAGQGMEACLVMAAEKEAYILTDRGTYLATADPRTLALLYDGDPILLNPYSLIEVSPKRYPELNHAGAQRLIAWMTSAPVQTLIANYQVKGNTLFHPMSEKPPAPKPR
jgi:tungstate transport system substrate-binding protein